MNNIVEICLFILGMIIITYLINVGFSKIMQRFILKETTNNKEETTK